MKLFKRKKEKFNRDDLIRFLCWWNMKYPGMEGVYHEPSHRDIDKWIEIESDPKKISQTLLGMLGLTSSFNEGNILRDGFDKYEVENFLN